MLKTTFEDEFEGSDVPLPGQANVIGIIEDGEIKSFLVTEVLLRTGMVWVKPSDRDTPASLRRILQMAHYAHDSIPEGASVITIASDPAFESLFGKLGMRRVEGTVFRKDF